MRQARPRPDPTYVDLPEVPPDPGLALERALRGRRSVRGFADRPLALADIARLLFAAQGITDAEGFRTAPSAGATYPLEVHLVAGRVDALPAGVWHYEVPRERLLQEATGDRRRALARAALGQAWLAEAPAVLVISAVLERTTRRYGGRGERYVHMEVGHAAQNLCLMASALALGATVVGAFEDAAVAEVLGLPTEQRPLCLLPVGYPAGAG